LVSVGVVEATKVKQWATEQGIPCENVEDIMHKKELKQAVLDNLLELAKANKLSGLEKIKKIHLINEPFTIENEILTPTLKIKRNIAKKAY